MILLMFSFKPSSRDSFTRMDHTGTIELLSSIKIQLNSGRSEDTFIDRASVETSITIVEQIEQKKHKKQWNTMLGLILSVGELVVQNLDTEVVFNAVSVVSREFGGFFDRSVLENMANDYQQLQILLTTASARITKIHASCCWLMEQVRKTN